MKSWKLEKEKSKTLFQKHNDWENYFVLPDFLSGITYKTALSYRSIYKRTNFERFINFIPENYKYPIILYCGVGGYYNLTSKTVYIGINPETTCANFYNMLYHEQCHIDYGKYIKNMPHEFQELVIDAITYKKYGIQKEDEPEEMSILCEYIDPEHPSTIIKCAQQYNLLTQNPEEEIDVFPCIS